MPRNSQTSAMVLAVNCPPHAPAPGHAATFQCDEPCVGHLAAGVGADGFENILNGYGVTFKLSGSDGTAVENKPGNIQPGQRHDAAGNGFVAADENDERVEKISRG